jgi:hypothetical protein
VVTAKIKDVVKKDFGRGAVQFAFTKPIIPRNIDSNRQVG